MKPSKLYYVFDRRDRATKTTKGSLDIEIYYNNAQYRISTGVTLLSTQWKNGRIVRCEDCGRLNTRIVEMMKLLNDYVTKQEANNVPTLSINMLKAIAEGNEINGESRSLLKWLEERINARDIEESTRRQHKVMLRSLKESGLFRTFETSPPST